MTKDAVNAWRRELAKKKRKDMPEKDRESARARRRELYRNMNSYCQHLPLSDDGCFNIDETLCNRRSMPSTLVEVGAQCSSSTPMFLSNSADMCLGGWEKGFFRVVGNEARQCLHLTRDVRNGGSILILFGHVGIMLQLLEQMFASLESSSLESLQIVDTTVESTHEHPLASLAVETKKLLKKDASLYIPILSKWNPRSAAVSASLLYKLYGSKLKPFVDAAEHLTEDVVSVFPAADGLEQYIMALISSVNEVETVETYCKGKLTPYQLETTSGTLVLRWVNSQLGRILEWVERTIKQEHWEPISPQQGHGSSIVEVYRIIEETVDHFFSLEVPMRPSELNSLFRGIDNAFQMFTNHVIEKLGKFSSLSYRRFHQGSKVFICTTYCTVLVNPKENHQNHFNYMAWGSLMHRAFFFLCIEVISFFSTEPGNFMYLRSILNHYTTTYS